MTDIFRSDAKLRAFAETFQGYSKSEIRDALKNKSTLNEHLSEASIEASDVSSPDAASGGDNPFINLFFDLVANLITRLVDLIWAVNKYKAFTITNNSGRTVYVWLKGDGKGKSNIAVKNSSVVDVLTHRDKWECNLLYVYVKDKKGFHWAGENEEHTYEVEGQPVIFVEFDVENTNSSAWEITS